MPSKTLRTQMNHHQENPHLKVDSILMDHKTGINEIDKIFQAGQITERDQKTLTLAIEIASYSLFGSFIFIMILLPSSAQNIREMFPNSHLSDPIGFMLWIKMSLFLISLAPLFFALHKSSQRLKGRLFKARKSF